MRACSGNRPAHCSVLMRFSLLPGTRNRENHSCATNAYGIEEVSQSPGTGTCENQVCKTNTYSANAKDEAALDVLTYLDSRSLLTSFKECASLASKEECRDFGGILVKVNSLEKAMAAHADGLRNGFDLDRFAASTLIDVYAKCGSMLDARLVFDRLRHHDVVSWTALIQGFAENGEEEVALELFSQMQTQGSCSANARTFLAASNACTGLARKEEGRQVDGGKMVKIGSLERGLSVHYQALKAGCDSNVFLTSSLINMYAKCGSLLDARMIFDRMRHHDAFSCTALMLGYADNGEEELALEICKLLQFRGSIAAGIFTAALNACTALAVKEEFQQVDDRLLKVAALEKGRAIHLKAVETGRDLDSHVACSLLNMYAKCGNLVEAFRVFESMPLRDVVSWNALMAGCVDNGEEELALEVFSRMGRPNRRSFLTALKACSRLARKEEATPVDGRLVRVKALEMGAAIHSQAVEHGCDSDLFLASTLVDMYAKCGSLVEAHKAFSSMPRRCVVSCNSLIHGYAESGEERLALELFEAMPQFPGCKPNSRTFIGALNACISLAAKEEAKQLFGRPVKLEALDIGMKIHSKAAELGCELDKFVGCSLVNMYAKCGSLDDAWRVFHGMPRRDVVSWNVLILGYAESEQPEVALKLFARMRDEEEGCEADSGTFLAVLKACASLVALETGQALHRDVYRHGLEDDMVLATCFVDFYAKCGGVAAAQRVFDSFSMTNIVSWSALLTGYSHQGDVKQVLDHFRDMEDEGVQPNAVTLTSVLAACSHAGLVDVARDYFQAMSFKYGIRPGIDHYHCLVDVLGRANHLDEAVAVVNAMPFEANAMTWKTLLGACRKWKNVEFGRLAFESLLELDEKDVAAYVLMANIYGSRGMVEEQQHVETMKAGARDENSVAERSWWTEDTGTVHSFEAGNDARHPQSQEILKKLGDFAVEMEEDGGNKRLCCHSERMAIGCALLNTVPGTAIRIVKNSLLCDGCHKVAAAISMLEKRTIICRDASRFHVFKDGTCCCGDYW
ncbi:pentatricopeptide repeat-containing protein At1g11290, chloroplastic-like [Selaginella moellendorffii]|uniref:pentatricopeptide repeat-containing protein At1g11290, chloroplastic-like n=1 Tax=Selaginella moellendorffii TaxID=88036 RepID=UPI000D1CFD45|nr:pentatricopeptide repeat-containing protein At1g11290, chloroplastic-like [Selaginella moellendorffii]|eukprot:XP_024526917.1 pentatricopeptide repeat-containing protein At1g11290, chloroplastic-like [Selaginella moellendorffii]